MAPLSAIAFLILMFGGMLLSFVRGPIWGLFTYLAVFYVHPPARWWGDELPEWRWALITAIAVLLSSLIHKSREMSRAPWYGNTPAKLLIAYAGWMWVQCLWASGMDDHLEGTILVTKYIILFYLIYSIIDDEKKLRGFTFAHVVGCCYLGWEAYNAGGGRLDGVGGPGIDEANRLGTHLSTGIMYAAALILAAENRIRVITFFLVPLILNGIILTGSRGAFLGLVAGGAALWRLRPKSKSKQFKIYALLGIVLLSLLAHQQFWDRMASITADSEDRDNSASSRLIFMQAEWEMFKDHPFGAGHRAFQYYSPYYLAPAVNANPEMGAIKGSRSSHSTFMAILGEQGIPGMLIYLGLFVWVYKTLSRLNKMDDSQIPESFSMYRAAFGSALMVIAVAGLFSNYFRAEVQIWALASLVVLERLVNERLALAKIESEKSIV